MRVRLRARRPLGTAAQTAATSNQLITTDPGFGRHAAAAATSGQLAAAAQQLIIVPFSRRPAAAGELLIVVVVVVVPGFVRSAHVEG